MLFYAHTIKGQAPEKWEPLFTPFGDGAEKCQRENSQKCAVREHLTPNDF
jgi:hypothetical protein